MDAIALGCLTALFLAGSTLTRRTIIIFTATGSTLLVLCLGFSLTLERLGLNNAGLGMTLLAFAACMLIAASAQTKARAPRILAPLLFLGRNSYEIYLTHMFVVFACFHAFMALGHPLRLVPILFLVTILLAGLLGYLVSRLFSEPPIAISAAPSAHRPHEEPLFLQNWSRYTLSFDCSITAS